jgi:hypothetical protein
MGWTRLAAPLRSLSSRWSAPQSSAHREELRFASARYSAGLRIPSAEWGARVLSCQTTRRKDSGVCRVGDRADALSPNPVTARASSASLLPGEPSDHTKHEFHNQDEDGQSETDGHDWRVAPRSDEERWATIATPEVSTARDRGFFFALASRFRRCRAGHDIPFQGVFFALRFGATA